MMPTGQLFNKSKSMRVGDRLLFFDKPLIMGILNVTPDSFYDGGMYQIAHLIRLKAERMLEDGASIIDIGACSTRPGSQETDEETERSRLNLAIKEVKAEFPEAVVSVDTYRSGIAEWAVKEYGVHIINDVSGGNFDPDMFAAIGRLKVPYILMHMLGSPGTMQDNPNYEDAVHDISLFFARKIQKLYEVGATDIIIDPGFGFGKTIEQNYNLLDHLNDFRIFTKPILVGLSRKSIIYKVLQSTPESSLNGTTVLNAVALLKGADILRVHDVKQASECIQMIEKIKL